MFYLDAWLCFFFFSRTIFTWNRVNFFIWDLNSIILSFNWCRHTMRICAYVSLCGYIQGKRNFKFPMLFAPLTTFSNDSKESTKPATFNRVSTSTVDWTSDVTCAHTITHNHTPLAHSLWNRSHRLLNTEKDSDLLRRAISNQIKEKHLKRMSRCMHSRVNWKMKLNLHIVLIESVHSIWTCVHDRSDNNDHAIKHTYTAKPCVVVTTINGRNEKSEKNFQSDTNNKQYFNRT